MEKETLQLVCQCCEIFRRTLLYNICERLHLRPYDLGAHYMEYFCPGLKFQSGAGLKFCSDYMEIFSLDRKMLALFCFDFIQPENFLAASRKSIQCLSFMFEQCSILMMLIFQLNAIIIMYELFGRKKRFAVSRCICLEKNGFKGESSSEGVIYLGSPDRSGQLVQALTSGGITLKENISQTPGEKEIFK